MGFYVRRAGRTALETLTQTGRSPVSLTAGCLTAGLAIASLILVLWTRLRFTALPNMLPLIAAMTAIDLASRLVRQTRAIVFLQTLLSGVLYLGITCFCAVIAAYASQRFALPLRDTLFHEIDLALGLDWTEAIGWVDRHAVVHRALHWAYDSLSLQVALPIVVLGLSNRIREMRAFIVAFTLALTITIVISALLPAGGPITLIDPDRFKIMHFTGATPLEHLARLREAGPLTLTDGPGGIATFPSFHAAVAVLIPLTLQRYRGLFIGLLVLDAAMLGGTITEGAHYFCDTLAGGGLAVFAHAAAARLIAFEDRSHLAADPAFVSVATR